MPTCNRRTAHERRRARVHADRVGAQAVRVRLPDQPGYLSAFWGPAGTTTPLDGLIVEPRPGGRFETLIVNNADGSTHHMRAVFDEVAAPHTLSWTESDSGMSTTMTFTEAGVERHQIRIHQRRVPDAMRGPDEQNGFQSSLDRFERYLRTADREEI